MANEPPEPKPYHYAEGHPAPSHGSAELGWSWRCGHCGHINGPGAERCGACRQDYA